MPKPDADAAIAYVVSSWPRLSQTFVLDEILALERLGVRVRIFATKRPSDEPIHRRLAEVRAPVTYLSLRRGWHPTARANIRLARDLRDTLCDALVTVRVDAIECFARVVVVDVAGARGACCERVATDGETLDRSNLRVE